MNKLLYEIEKGTKEALMKKKIILYVIQNGSSTISELAKEIGMSVPTTTKIINSMCDNGSLEDYGKLETNGGRHPNLYGLNPDAAYFVGVDIKQFGVNIALTDFKGDMIDFSMEVPYVLRNSPEALDRLITIIQDFIEKQTIDKTKILNIALNISGRVNSESGYSYSIFYFEERPLVDILRERLNYRVTIDNDTRAMTYGEYIAGCVAKEKDVIFVNLSWGLAIGIIIDGKVYRGKSGFSGEFGHVKSYDNEIICHCGKKGCLETEVSGSAMHRRLMKRLGEGVTSLLSKKFNKNEQITLTDIVQAINREDVLCIDLLEDIGRKLGEHLAGIINIFNPEMVVIGGTLALTGDYIMQPIITSIRKYSLNLVNKDSVIITSKLKEKTGVIGACMIARLRIFEN
ncbi:MAG: ROK family transcriptional regulator [Dysgonamonadaceae bacterium]|jgi:predicted NBD/HSP70 family sugar kinase|nr:ROK family transcriptional regulator [Dysgonamonadaceae bacterium]